jgi:23S rRNA (pseudouridine1915-N3)-methyltransferase
MEIQLICIGKTDNNDLQKLILNYQDRLKHYIKFTLQIIPDIKGAKNLSQEQQKNKEAELIERQIKSSDLVVLLDEHGKEYSSVGFSEFLNKKMNSGSKRLIFIIGGAYGFSKKIHQKYNSKIALSQMTFSHQMIRLLFVEQLYRAYTILKNEPYHHR